MDEKRIEWIDTAKGLGMILVMLGHSQIPKNLIQEIYSFHMPLFFFLAGCLFRNNKSFTEFLNKRFRTLIIPYISFSLISYVYWICVYRHFSNLKVSTIKPLIGTFYAVRGTDWTLHNGILWFVLCLFFAELLLYFIVKLTNNNAIRISVILLMFSIISHLYSTYIGIALPWSIDAATNFVVFVGLGYVFKLKGLLNTNTKLVTPRFLILFFLINVVLGHLNIQIDVYNNYYGNYVLYYLSAFTGIMASIIFARLIVKNKMLKYIGKNSLIFLAIHGFFIFPIVRVALNKIIVFNIYTWWGQLLYGVSCVVITSIIMMPIVYLINRYIPFVLGKSSLKSKINKQTVVY